MINVTIDGITKPVEEGLRVKEILTAFNDTAEAVQFVCAVRIDGEMFDLDHKVKNDCTMEVLTFRDIQKQRESQDVPEADASEQAPEILLEELGMADIFSQDMLDTIENEVKSVLMGGMDDTGLLLEPSHAMELLDSVADGSFVSEGTQPEEAETVAEEAEEVETVAEEAEQIETVAEKAEQIETVAEEAEEAETVAEETEQTETVAEEAEEAETVAEETEQTETVAEEAEEVESVAEEAEASQPGDGMIEELAMLAEELEEPETASALTFAQEWTAAQSEETEETAREGDQETQGASKQTPPQKPAQVLNRRTMGNAVKAAVVLLAVAAVGWFGGRAAMQALGARNGQDGKLIRRPEIVTQSDAVSGSDVSPSDAKDGIPAYDASLLETGSANNLVKQLQECLSTLEFLEPASVRGTYDRATQEAVTRFQAAYSLPATGRVDRETFKRIFREAKAAQASAAQPVVTDAMAPVSPAEATTVTSSTTTTATTTERTTVTTSRTTTTTRKTTTERTTTTSRRTTTTRTTTTTTRATTTTSRRRRTTTTRTTTEPTSEPTSEPTVAPTEPTSEPTSAPTEPTAAPTPAPTEPTSAPTEPTAAPVEPTPGE